MSKIELILSATLTLSIFFNIAIAIYARNVVVKLLSVSEELGDLNDMIDTFYGHVSSIFEMEMFYGDETIGFLVEHAKSLSEQLGTFEYIYSLTEADEEKQVEEDDNEEQPET
jgi:hypothetical protein